MNAQVESLNSEIIARIQSNRPGILITNITIDNWKQLEIPRHLRDRDGLQWNLFIEPASGQVTLSPRAAYTMTPSVCLGDHVESEDGWAVGSACKYAY